MGVADSAFQWEMRRLLTPIISVTILLTSCALVDATEASDRRRPDPPRLRSSPEPQARAGRGRRRENTAHLRPVRRDCGFAPGTYPRCARKARAESSGAPRPTYRILPCRARQADHFPRPAP